MNDVALHWHHLVPKHAGGDDSKLNLVQLTIEDHAIAHKVLYGLYKRWQDKIAWLTLSGRIDIEAARIMVMSERMKGNDFGSKTKGKKRPDLALWNRQNLLGKSNHRKGKKSPWVSERNRLLNSQQVTCPKCHKTGGRAGMFKHHFDRCIYA